MACRMLMKADVTSAPTRADTRHTKLIRLARNAASADTNVVLESRGVVLVVGDDATVVPHATRLAASLKVVMCAPGAQDALGLPRSVRSLGGRIVSITGRMGAFTARAATSRDDSADIGAFGPNPDRTFDLVLDLSRTPHLREAVPPLGYFAPGGSAGAIAEALAILPTLVGRFAKPRYFEYAADLCTHGAQGFSGCSRCIDVCSTAAIASARDRVVVDPYLCQGCANCTLACPTGALSFKAVTRGEKKSGSPRWRKVQPLWYSSLMSRSNRLRAIWSPSGSSSPARFSPRLAHVPNGSSLRHLKNSQPS